MPYNIYFSFILHSFLGFFLVLRFATRDGLLLLWPVVSELSETELEETVLLPTGAGAKMADILDIQHSGISVQGSS